MRREFWGVERLHRRFRRTTHYETFHRYPLVPANRFFGVYFHVYFSDRYLPPHDHPWWNVTILVRGRYQERLIKNYNAFDRGRPIDSSNRFIVFRKATTAHAMQVERGPLWTIFIHGPEWNVAGGRA